LRLVPIRFLQPRPQSASGYCYSGRLYFRLLRSGLTTPGFPVLHVTALPSCCPFVYPRGVTSWTKRHSGILLKPRKVFASFPVQFRTEVLLFPEPCDSLFERTFPFFSDFLNIPGPGPSSSDFGSHDAQSRRSD